MSTNVCLQRKDVLLTAVSTEAARQCLEVVYVYGSEIESALVVCACIRQACGLEESDLSLFDDEQLRVFTRAFGLTTRMVGFDALKVDELINELEISALTSGVANLFWDTLAAAVGDAEPQEADSRMISIFRALRGGNHLQMIETKKVRRATKARIEKAILEERQAQVEHKVAATKPTFWR